MAEPVVATYSIAACDLTAGHWGVATQSKFLAVGSVVPWAEPGVGAVATQAYATRATAPKVSRSSGRVRPAEETVAQLTAADEGRESASSESSTQTGAARASPAPAASTGQVA